MELKAALAVGWSAWFGLDLSVLTRHRYVLLRVLRSVLAKELAKSSGRDFRPDKSAIDACLRLYARLESPAQAKFPFREPFWLEYGSETTVRHLGN